MPDFLLELRSEEIPARMQVKAKADLERLFVEALAKAGLAAERIETFATPRRLALIAHGLPLATEAVSEETKGPKVGAPPQALEGFTRKLRLSVDQLTERDGVYFAVVEKAGRATADVLAEAIPGIVRAFPWPKSMRWGTASLSTESLRWVRPLQGIVALLGDDVVPCEVDSIVSGRETMGHRFHSSGPISIANPSAYVETLRAAHVIIHFSERCRIIREGAAKAAADAGLVIVEDEALVIENAGLTEWPVPLLGRFDAGFLDVPPEVIQLTARVNQKYFVCHDADGKLANAFVCTANIDAHDGGAAIIAGNEKVLAARLADAKFFWEADLKVPLVVQREKLSQIVFHEKLGTVADKVERVAKLARWLCEEGIVTNTSPSRGGGPTRADGVVVGSGATPLHHPSGGPPPQNGEVLDLAALAERAARLCKADLVTGMVGEFPELQGVMGGHYARAQGEHACVADAIRDHYKPVGQGDDVPTASVTVAVSLADKLDTLIRFFGEGEFPTGSKDPFALRRATLAAIRLLLMPGKSGTSLTSILLTATYFHFEQARDSRSKQIAAEVYFGLQDVLGRTPSMPEYEQALTERDIDKVAEGLLRHYHGVVRQVLDFFIDRLKVQQREAGVRHDLIDAVFALGGEDDLVRLLARVNALQGFVETAEGADLLVAYRRAANILKQANSDNPPRSRGGGGEADGGGVERPSDSAAADTPLHRFAVPLPTSGEDLVETDLRTALNTAEPLAEEAIEAEDFEGAMAALASLRTPIDAFFEGVMVNDPDPDVRAARQALLARFRDAVHKVADFSKIEG